MTTLHPRSFGALLAIVALVAGLAAFAFTAQSARADASVNIAGLAFGPSSVTVEVGDTVTWTHSDGEMPHTVTSTDGGPIDSGTLNDGEDYSFTFTEAGTFEYECTIHPTMTGSVTVQEAAANGDDAGAESPDDAAPPATGTGTTDSGSSVPWALIVIGILVIALAAGVFGVRTLRN